MNVNERRNRLRQILQGRDCVLASSVGDPLSARIGDELGVQVGVLGGSVASLAVLGAPDLIVLTLSELVEQARRITRVARLSLLVDADHGYGNALNVMRTVEELQNVGVCGISIEDTLLPRAYGAPDPFQLITVEEGADKIRAAVRARGDSGMAILARTSALALEGVDGTLRRLRAYEQAGADGLFIPGLSQRADLDRIAQEVRLPIVLGGGSADLLGDSAYLASRGVRICFSGHRPYAEAARAFHDAVRAERERLGCAMPEPIAPAALMDRLSRTTLYDQYVADYLAPKPGGKSAAGAR
ncbi:MAG TPA: isocitrate lyase/PEP mutase family protein [Bordetella sp.]|nr:isocitrate lyase/PEP mutase family protein [Bordetella sp.]